MKYMIGGNWKMNGDPHGASEFLHRMAGKGSSSAAADIVIFPPFTLLAAMAEPARSAGIALGGQDLFWEEKGAYTGEISPGMLREAGAQWFLAGHSERRHLIGETDTIVRKKLDAGLKAGLKAVLCVGELLEQRETGRTEEVVEGQLRSALEGIGPVSSSSLVIAYEPVWAIGTGLTATPDEAQRMHSLIREWTVSIMGEDTGGGVRIQYGGSVKPGNAAEILARPSVNGALVGGASLKAESFWKIVQAAGSG